LAYILAKVDQTELITHAGMVAVTLKHTLPVPVLIKMGAKFTK